MRIDHLVWYDADLERGRSYFAESLAAAPAFGGSHPGEGTANYLVSLGEHTYLEILGRDVAQAHASLDSEIAAQSGSGLYHWACGGIPISDLAARAEAAGLACSISAGGRVKPDGSRLDWTCLGIRGHEHGALVPFFIDWHETVHPARSAPRGGNIVEFVAVSPHAASLKAIYDALGVDVAVRQGATAGVVATIEAASVRLMLRSFAPLPRGYVI